MKTKIVNSDGNSWKCAPGNIQKAIDDLYDGRRGGMIHIPSGQLVETDPWLLDQDIPIYFRGQGAGWHDTVLGTNIKWDVGSGVDCVTVHKEDTTISFGGIEDLTFYGESGRDFVKLYGVSDYVIRNVYMDGSGRDGVSILGHDGKNASSWNIQLVRNWIENCTGNGIFLDATEEDIVRIWIRNNVFYANNRHIYGLGSAAANNRMRFIKVLGNQMSHSVAESVYFYKQLYDSIIAHNDILDPGSKGIILNAVNVDDCCERNIVESNTLLKVSTGTHGIMLANYNLDSVVMSNVAKGFSADVGVSATGTTTGCVIDHNVQTTS
jgi:hypothetical protein